MKEHSGQPSILFAALALIHLLYFISTLIQEPAPLSDSADYLNASRNLYSQGVLYCGNLSDPVVDELFTRRPPLYPLLIGAGAFTGSGLPVFLFQIVVSMLSIFLAYRIFLPGKEGRPGAFFALVLLLFTPAQFIYANRIMAEVPFQLTLVGMAWCVYRFYREREKGRDLFIWLFNLMLTLGMATKPVLFPFALLFIPLSLWLFLRSRRRAFILALLLPVLWITLYSTWNYNRTGSFQYSSIQTANMVNYNLRYFIMGSQGEEAAAAEVDRLYARCDGEASYKEKQQCLGRGARELILEEPMRYGLYHLKGSLRFFLDPGRFDVVTFFNMGQADSPGFLKALSREGLPGVVRFLRLQGWGFMLFLGVLGLFKLVKLTGFLLFLGRGNASVQLRVFLALLVGYLALVTGPLGASRFLLPVELLLIGGAVVGWMPVLQRHRSKG